MRRCFAIVYVIAVSAFAPMSSADAPAVTVTYPTPNLTISLASAPRIRFQVSVSDADESVFDVGYYVCPSTGATCASAPLIAGVVKAVPFDLVWTPPPVLSGTAVTTTYLVWAQADNVLGQSRQSPPVPFTLLQPAPGPSVTLVAPALPSEFSIPAAPVLYATAVAGNTSPPSAIVQVDFLDGNDVIGSVSSVNVVPDGYAYVWRTAQPGGHLVSARALDSLGDSTTSAPVPLWIVEDDDPPQIRLTAPRSGEVYAPGAAVALAATTASADGTIERVEFVEGDTVIATARSAPYAATWLNPPPGNFAIVARAFDDLGVVSASQASYIQVLEIPRDPLVALTAPTSGSTVSANAPLTLSAAALSPDGTVAQVDFFAGNTLLGSATASPYAFTWPAPQVGPQVLSAKARDARGRTTTSSPVTVTVTSSLLPTVNLTAPLGGTFTLPASITVSANASESGGTIANVDFYANGNLIGSKATGPYSIVWSNASPGGYNLSAKATDGAGTSATSATVPITVLPPSPTAAITSPANGSRFAKGQSITISAQVTTPGSIIAKVDFESDGSIAGTIVPTSGVSSGTYTLDWSGAAPGTHNVNARVFSTSGAAIASSSVVITVADFSVRLLEPASGQVFQVGIPVALAAEATEGNGSIAKMEFYGDGALIGTTVTSPFTSLWNAATAGTHSIVAKAYDANGLSATSRPSPMTVVSAPTIQIDAGVDGATIADDNATISGTIQAPFNSAVAINGRQAVVDLNGHFFVEDLKLQTGANSVSVTLNAQGTASISKTVSINSTGTAPFEVALDRQQGLAPLTVNLSINDRGNAAFNRITIDTTDDGTPDLILTGLPPAGTTQSITYGAPGLYTLRVVVYDANDKAIYTATRRVRAIDPAEAGYRLASVYTTLVNNLAVNNVNGALTAFVDGARDRYSSVFSALGASLPGIAGQLGTISNIVVMEDAGELTVARPVGGNTQLFMIYLIRGSDGVWRIETM